MKRKDEREKARAYTTERRMKRRKLNELFKAAVMLADMARNSEDGANGYSH
jgi:hypothetical protein